MSARVSLLGSGYVERIADDGVLWGTLDTGATFDLPAEFHEIGDEVRFSAGIDCDYVVMVIGSHQATILWCDDNPPEGIEILEREVLRKTN